MNSGSHRSHSALPVCSNARNIHARAAAAGISRKDYAHTDGVAQTWDSRHSLRADHATYAAEQGADTMAISRTTRHRRLDSLAQYVRPFSTFQDSTAGKIGL